MLIDERHNQILGIIKEKTYVSVETLAERVYASPATIRRDLVDLERAGLIQRVRGGASVLGSSTGETSSLIRRQTNVLEKRRIAEAAFSYIKEGNAYFMDSSTSVGQLITLLNKVQVVTIITNGIENAWHLANLANVRTYIVGGQVQTKAASCVGADAIDAVSNFNCDAFFFSCHGFSIKTGPTEGTIDQQRCKQAMLAHSLHHILLADHTKFGTAYVASVCPLKDIDILITDELPSQDYVDALAAAGVQLIVAKKIIPQPVPPVHS